MEKDAELEKQAGTTEDPAAPAPNAVAAATAAATKKPEKQAKQIDLPFSGTGGAGGSAGVAASVEEDPDSGDLKFNHNRVTLSKQSFLKKAAKEARRILRKAGLDPDVEKLSAKAKAFAEWEAKQEEEKKAQLSKEEQLLATIQTEREAREEAEKRMRRAKDKVRVERKEREMASSARQHIHPDKVSWALDLLASEIQRMARSGRRGRREARKLDVGAWFQKLGEAPEFSKSGASAQSVQKSPATNGVSPQKERKAPQTNPASMDMFRGKVVKAGQPNSMTPEEVAAYARSLNLPWSS